MIGWLDLYSFALGFVIGSGCAAAGFAISVRLKVHRSGDSRRTNQKNISAAGDVVAGDKTTRSAR